MCVPYCYRTQNHQKKMRSCRISSFKKKNVNIRLCEERDVLILRIKNIYIYIKKSAFAKKTVFVVKQNPKKKGIEQTFHAVLTLTHR